MLLQKYEVLLQNLNFQITNWSFDIEKNKDKLEKIINIYNELKSKNYDKVKSLIKSLWLLREDLPCYESLQKDSLIPPMPWCPAPTVSTMLDYWEELKVSKKMSYKAKEWDITQENDDDNIEAFNSIEMMSAIFLQNLKDKIWTQK